MADRGMNVSIARQRDVEIYTFVISADQLVQYGCVERFGEQSDGVNRKYDEKHAIEIAEAMLRPDTVMLDSILGDLKGGWTVADELLVPDKGAFLSIDDGQHRFSACSILNPEERARWSFVVTATMGLDFETRMRIFRQQRLRKRIDSRLDLAQRNRLDEWKNDAEREAYSLILRLNSDPSSPLRGQIILEETVKRPYEHRHRTEGINANGLWATLHSIMGKGSPLHALSLEKRSEVALNMIFVASEVWPKAWASSTHILTTARGINAVLKLIVSGKNFRMVIGDDFRSDSLRKGLTLAARFNWTAAAHRNEGTKVITAALDEAIGRGHQRSLESGDAPIVA